MRKLSSLALLIFLIMAAKYMYKIYEERFMKEDFEPRPRF